MKELTGGDEIRAASENDRSDFPFKVFFHFNYLVYMYFVLFIPSKLMRKNKVAITSSSVIQCIL